MEFAPGGSLLDQRQLLTGWTYQQRLQTALQIANALDYLHTLQPALAHLDVKP